MLLFLFNIQISSFSDTNRDELILYPNTSGDSEMALHIRNECENVTLATWQGLADKGEGGFSWRDELLIKNVCHHLHCSPQAF